MSSNCKKEEIIIDIIVATPVAITEAEENRDSSISSLVVVVV